METLVDTRLEHLLREQYPALTHDPAGNHADSAFNYFGFQCHDGWYPLLVEFLGLLDDSRMRTGGWIVLTQVKQKFGELRVHTNGPGIEKGSLEQHLFDSLCRHFSRCTCEFCGQLGSVRGIDGALITTCERHAERESSVQEAEREQRVSRYTRYRRKGIETTGLIYVEADEEGYPPGKSHYRIFQLPSRISSAKEHSIRQQLIPLFDGAMSSLEAQARLSALEKKARLIGL